MARYFSNSAAILWQLRHLCRLLQRFNDFRVGLVTLGNVGVDVVEGVDRVLREPSAGFVSVQRRAAVGVSVEVDVGALDLWTILIIVFSSPPA